MGVTGLIILAVSWINYLNLNMAGIYRRQHNIILYKVQGCPNFGIMLIYFLESFMIATLSLFLAFILISVSFPTLAPVTGNILNRSLLRIIFLMKRQ